eukprot:4229931-Pyramimonas_sp.AAC.1
MRCARLWYVTWCHASLGRAQQGRGKKGKQYHRGFKRPVKVNIMYSQVWRAKVQYDMICCGMPRHAVLCCAMPCYFTLRYAVVRYVVLC